MFSTSRGYHDTCGGYHEYIKGFSVHQEDTMSISGDIMSISGDVQYIGGMFSISGDVQYIGVFNRNWKDFIKLLPHMYHDIPPMYWTSPVVLITSLRCTHGIPPMYWTSPNVHMVSPTFIMISPDVWNIPWCTHDIPQMYWTPLDVLNIPRCTEHTLYRVKITWFSIFIKEYTIQKIKMSHNLSCLETRFRITVPLIVYCTATINSLSDSVSYTTFLFLKWCVHNHFVKIHSGFS